MELEPHTLTNSSEPRKTKEGEKEVTLRPAGPLRHMGVVVARHSTQLLAPFSGTTIPSICNDGPREAEERSAGDRRASMAAN